MSRGAHWFADPAFRARQADRMRRQWEDPAYRAAHLARLKSLWRDPARRMKHAATMRRYWKVPEFRAAQQTRLDALGTRLRKALDDLLDVVVADPTGCWLWRGYLNPDGYGVTSWQGCKGYAHRIFFEIFVGPIGDADVHHTCHVRACVYPDHLRLLSPEDHARLTNAERNGEHNGEHNREHSGIVATDATVDLTTCLCGKSVGVFAAECCEAVTEAATNG